MADFPASVSRFETRRGFPRNVVAGHAAAHLVVGVKETDATVSCTVRQVGDSDEWEDMGNLGPGTKSLGRVATALAGYAYEREAGLKGAPQDISDVPAGTDLLSSKLATASLGDQPANLKAGWRLAIDKVREYGRLIDYVASRLQEGAGPIDVDDATARKWVQHAQDSTENEGRQL